MTRHDDATCLRHMLDYAKEAVELAEGHRREDLDADRLFRYAMTHLVEVLGEAGQPGRWVADDTEHMGDTFYCSAGSG